MVILYDADRACQSHNNTGHQFEFLAIYSSQAIYLFVYVSYLANCLANYEGIFK